MTFVDCPTVGVVGLGYVGLPLALAFADRYTTIGVDHDALRVDELRDAVDRSGEVPALELARTSARWTTRFAELSRCDVIIIAVPTPVTARNLPDTTALRNATASAARHMKRGAVIVYESTVYPGATEQICIPLLSAHGRVWRSDFWIGYSPERVNPGDKTHTVRNVRKVVSGDTVETAGYLAKLYGSVLQGGIYLTPTIAVAEAAKVLENTQRDVNIALMNECAILFDRLGISTREVLKAAATKWNFAKYTPGLVGGHCVGVDPYYLIDCAVTAGCALPVVSAARHVNSALASCVADKVSASVPAGAAMLIAGVAFKPDVRDCRNSQAPVIARLLRSRGYDVALFDPLVSAQEVSRLYDATVLAELPDRGRYAGVIVATAHRVFRDALDLSWLLEHASYVFDVAGLFEEPPTGVGYWRL